MYGPKPYARPPTKAAGHRHQFRSTKNIEVALLANARRSKMLNAAIGPSRTVTGDAKSPRSGAEVLSARLTPKG